MTNESAIKQIRQRAEILNYHPECIQEKTSSPFFQVFNKEERGRAKKRFQNFLRRHSETGSPWSEPLQNSSEGQIPMKNVSPATKVHNIESVPSGLPPEEKSDHVLMGKKSTQRFSPIKKVTKTKTDSGLSEKNNVNVVLVEEPLPSTSKGKTHYTKITQREEKTNRDSEYTSAFSRPHFDNPEEEAWAQMVSAQYSFLNQYLSERKKEKMRKGFESTESDTSDEEPVHSTSRGRTHSA
ncbi:uncharacterized protein, partial [Alexandromys fortis]|uniref:uncharacterized protein n=1 Tax=Alexandromys fortis TaxID=100897 RepID=UPI002152EBD7